MDLGCVVFLKPPRACRGFKKAENGDCAVQRKISLLCHRPSAPVVEIYSAKNCVK